MPHRAAFDIGKEIRLTIIGRFGLLRGPRGETHLVCEDAERLTRLRPARCIDLILLRDTYAGITRRDLNPRRCPLRNSARTARMIFPPLIVPRPIGVVVVVVVLNCGYSYSSRIGIIYSPGRDPLPAPETAYDLDRIGSDRACMLDL